MRRAAAQYGERMAVDDDLLADGGPEKEFHPGIAARLARKTAAGGALIRDAHGRMLFVEPIYKSYLEIPGGVTEENESPLATCRREVREEIGLSLLIGRLLVVDWIPVRDIWLDSLQFVFDGGVLDDDQIAAITLADDELRAFEFLTLDEAGPNLRPSMARRLRAAVDAAADGVTRYVEFGRLPE